MIVDLPAASMRRRDIFARSLANHSPRRVPQVRSWFMNLGFLLNCSEVYLLNRSEVYTATPLH
jgi:hypothetical protein